MTKRLLAVVLMLGGLLGTSSADAAFVVFDDRNEWRQAAGGGSGDLVESFDAFGGDETYSQSSPVPAGFLTLSTTALPVPAAAAAWRVDTGPPEFAEIPSVNGTAYATTLAFGDDIATVLSCSAVVGLAFDFGAATLRPGLIRLTTSLGDITTFVNTPAAGGFVGVLYDTGETFTSLTWSGPGGAIVHAGIDEVEAYTTLVPVPPALWLLASALGYLWVRRSKLG